MTATPDDRARAASRRALAPWVLVVALIAAAIASGAVVVQSVQGIASAFLAPPPLASTEWVQRIVRLSSQELAFGELAGALIIAAGASVVIALAVAAVRRGARIASGVWLIPPAILGAVLVSASFRIAQQASVTPDFTRLGVTELLTSTDARGLPGLAETLGLAGVLVLAGAAGCAAVSSRVALIAGFLVAAALSIGTVAAIGQAAAPIDELMKAPAYPARSIEPDPLATTIAPVLGLGAGAFAVAALGAVAVRSRRRADDG